MTVNIKRIDKSLPLPVYHTKGSVGFDFYAREEIKVAPNQTALVPLNIIMEVPKGYLLSLVPRSSTPKKGIMIPNSPGTIDQDYHGEEDELRLWVYNFTKKKVVVEKGERICQGLLIKVGIAKFKEVKKMKNKSRGGFGTTG
ncbi:MAG: dUTPase [Candidatus Levybacteria bacterium RIFCSPHIGHO2_01_FULL_37_17]|nr:MAG: dUTPase [Candidatus Levybacteria bacterium RIFCSPHIGHO2_01_FULL_37_17]OGH36906.1 MAG: dUTPase [Candidatus Levybacteria bacterium RIFCSPLOWO2_01_FULL_38_23]